MKTIVRIIFKLTSFGSKRSRKVLFYSILFLWGGFPAFGFQGIMQTSFGARQAGMGGAFQAVGGSVMDLESNPSHLGRLTSAKWEFGMAVHFAQIKYYDSFMDSNPNLSYSNDITENPKAVLPYIGYMMPVSNRLGIGFSLYTQGGGGGSFSNINRLAPDKKSLNETLRADIPLIGPERRIKEDLEFKFMLTKLTFGSGYRFNKLSVGVGVDFVYTFMEMKRTYFDISRSIELPGSLNYSSDPSYSYGGKFGASYDFTEGIRFAYSYTVRSMLHLDGTMKVVDSDSAMTSAARVSRYMIWPDRHILGISYSTPSWIFDFDVKFIPWSQSFRSSKFILDQPSIRTPVGSETNTMQMNFRWRDQYCFAVGAEYKWSHGLRFRTGYSYAKTPMTPQGLSPMLGTTTEHHLAGGVGYYVNDYAFHFALEYGFPNAMKGSESSDWGLAHSIFSAKDIQLNQFQFSKSVSVVSMYFGLEKNI